MAIVTERVYNEINSIVVSTLNLSATTIVVKATKFLRFDWRTLVHFFEQSQPGISPPWFLLRPGPTEEAAWAMGTHHELLPIELFIIEDERNEIATQINGTQSITTSTQTITVDDTTRMFVGQRLDFRLSMNQVDGIVTNVFSSTQVTVSGLPISFSLPDNSLVTSDITSDVDCKVELLKTAFLPGTVFSNFAILEDIKTDVSDMNPANDLEESNYPLFAGSIYMKVLVGETI